MTRAALAIAVLVAGAFAAASAAFPVADSDMYWHLANARETLARGLLHGDTFSWTAIGAPVSTDQWLGEIVMYASYVWAGWTGVLAVRTLAVAAVVVCIVAAALARGRGSPVVGVAIALPAILLSRFTWTERPELIGVALFAALVLLLQLPGDRPLLALAPLLVVWANVHGSFALGAAIVAGVVLIRAAGERAWRRAYAVAAIGALASLVLAPAGVGTLATPGVHLIDPPRSIQEWAVPDPTTLAGAIWAVVLLVVVATACLEDRARPTDLVVIVPTALLSLVAIRHTPLLAIAATPYLAEHLPGAIAGVARRVVGPLPPPQGRTGGAAPLWVSPAIAVLGIAMILGAVAVAPREPNEGGYPSGALPLLPRGPGLFAQYDWGGWLIWRAPATPVFIDGRLGPYRGDVLRDYQAILEARPGWRDVVTRRAVRWLLVRPGDPVAVRAVELGWRVAARDRSFVLLEVPATIAATQP